MWLRLFFILPTFFLASDALAYLDPASGSAILYIVISVFSAVVYFFKNNALSIANLVAVKLNFKKDAIIKKHRVVFYSEGKQYWSVFSSVMKWLNDQGHECLYLTSDKQDPGLSSGLAHITSKYLGNINFSAAYLAQLEADFVGMTTPQLDVLTIKRSKKVKHYGHILHAPGYIHLSKVCL